MVLWHGGEGYATKQMVLADGAAMWGQQLCCQGDFREGLALVGWPQQGTG